MGCIIKPRKNNRFLQLACHSLPRIKNANNDHFLFFIQSVETALYSDWDNLRSHFFPFANLPKLSIVKQGATFIVFKEGPNVGVFLVLTGSGKISEEQKYTKSSMILYSDSNS